MTVLHISFLIAAFSIFFGGSLYFVKLWFQTKRKYPFLIFFALGFGLAMLFKVPNLLANAGITLKQQDFYLYFLITLFWYLLSYYFFAKGLQNLHNKFWQWHTDIFFFALSFCLILYFGSSFFMSGMNIFLPVWLSHIIFYIPAQLYLFVMLYKSIRIEIRENKKTKDNLSRPAFLLMVGIWFLFMTSIAYVVVQTGPYATQLWFLSVTASWGITLVQCLAGLFLFFGFRSLAKLNLKK